MASLAEQPYQSLFPPQQHNEDFTSYPEPPTASFATGSPASLSVCADVPFGGNSSYPAVVTTTGSLEATLYHTSPANTHFEEGDVRLSSSSLSSASVPSAPSSVVGSPQSNHGQLGLPEWHNHHVHTTPSIVGNDYMAGPDFFTGPGMEDFATFDFGGAPAKPFVDPSLIHPEIGRQAMGIPSYEAQFHQSQPHPFNASPALSASPQPNMMRNDSTSPYLHSGHFQTGYAHSPYGPPTMDPSARRVSMATFISPGGSGSGDYSGDESKEKQRCTYPDCGKVFKDLKAHMLTHQNERPEKCPIQTCEYHIKGFARKYDKNRHTLTHYKGTMVCGFCPGSGSPAEKSFNRADVFKRHLTAVHGVEQTPPNSRKKSSGVAAGKKITGYAPDATGKCSTCSQTFSNAQDFYEHLDDCVLRIVQQEDPAEAINAQRLAEVENDKMVHHTLEKNNLPTTTPSMQSSGNEDDEGDHEMGGEDDEASELSPTGNLSPSSKKRGNPAHGVQKSHGMTHSRGGVPMATKPRGRKSRRDYPSSWGFDQGQMTMRKRIMAVFDGPRRLAKDDMMLSTDHEVRIKLGDGKAYVTDLDVQTMKRAEGFLGATDEEKGHWISDDPTEEQLKEMQDMLKTGSTSI